MRKLITLATLLMTFSAFAGDTGAIFVRGETKSEVEQQLLLKVDEINDSYRIPLRGRTCQSPKVYAATAPKKSYRANRFGELEPTWSAVIKVRCSNNL